MSYEYKEKEKKNGNPFVSIRDQGDNCLLEAERKGDRIEMIIYFRNDHTTRMSIPAELFQKMAENLAGK